MRHSRTNATSLIVIVASFVRCPRFPRDIGESLGVPPMRDQAVTLQSAALQHRYLQTKFLIVPIGFSELPALAWRSAVFRSAATLGSFFFAGCSAITMAQYVSQRVCSVGASASQTMSALDSSRFALWPGEFCHMWDVCAHVLVPAAMFSAAMDVRTPEIRAVNDPATL